MKKWKTSILSVLALGTVAFGQGDPNVLCPSEVAEGFKLLFDGTSAVSFRSNFVDYVGGNETNTNLDAGWQYDAVNKAIKSGGNEPDSRSKEKISTTTGWDLRFSYRNPSNQGVIYMMTVAGGASWGTGIEFGISYMMGEHHIPFVGGILILVGLAFFKAWLVAKFFMHLKYDPRILAIIAVLPLVLATPLNLVCCFDAIKGPSI